MVSRSDSVLILSNVNGLFKIACRIGLSATAEAHSLPCCVVGMMEVNVERRGSGGEAPSAVLGCNSEGMITLPIGYPPTR